MRAILLDPRSSRRGALADVATDLGRRQQPMASPRLVAEAIERVRHRVEGQFGRDLAAAAELRRDLTWSLAWPEPGPDATVVEGRIDLAHRDAKGAWHLVQVADASTPRDVERLRAALSIRLAPRLGLDPIGRAWHLFHGPDGGLVGAEPLGDAAIDAMLVGLAS